MSSKTSLPMTAAVLASSWVILPAAAQSFETVRVRSVVDGDTFWADLNGRPTRFRLAYVDAPELTQGQWGRLSQEALQKLLPPGSLVQVDTLYITPEGLHIVEVYNADGLVNLEMLRQGQAVVYERFLHEANRERYLEAQGIAQAATQAGDAVGVSRNSAANCSFCRALRFGGVFPAGKPSRSSRCGYCHGGGDGGARQTAVEKVQPAGGRHPAAGAGSQTPAAQPDHNPGQP